MVDTSIAAVATESFCNLHRMDHEVVEMQLILPRWQISALEEAAQSRGMTTGQILRRVINDLFCESENNIA